MITWMHSILFLVWLVYTKPFESAFQNWMTIFTEKASLIVYALLTLFLWADDVTYRL